MGDRAVITIAKFNTNGEVLKEVDNNELGVYLHWDGGYDSVSAFLHYCNLKEYASPEQDCYGWARLCQVIGNYFGGTLSIGIDKCGRLDCDNGDNGVYLIKNWQIVGRVFETGEQYSYDLLEMMKDINNNQPKNEQVQDQDILEYLFKNKIINIREGCEKRN